MLKRISDRIQDQRAKQKRIVVHFNHPKPVAPGTRIQEPAQQTLLNSDDSTGNDSQASESPLPYQVVDDDDLLEPPVLQQPAARRYPVRNRQPPGF